MIYLDHNATTPICDASRKAILSALDAGNPSSVHGVGRAGRAIIETARAGIAAMMGVEMEGVVFTSGGTEACNLALATRTAPNGKIQRLIISATEHPAILHAAQAQDLPMQILPVDSNGYVDISVLAELLADPAPALVAVMAANNETGVIQPMEEISAQTAAHGSLLFCDAVQMTGKRALSLSALGADMASLSGHKFGAPMGVGALVMREGVVLSPRQIGGGQELRRRGGTESVITIAGLGAAVGALESRLQAMPRVELLRARLEEALLARFPDLYILGRDAIRLPNTSCFAFGGDAAHLVVALDLAGFAVSAGAACSSGKISAGHVAQAMGLDESYANAVIRVSLAPENTQDDIDAFIAAFAKIIETKHARVA